MEAGTSSSLVVERELHIDASPETVFGFFTDPALMVRVDERGGLLASWQTIAGCGSSGATGTAGIKWIGRGTTGGLFNVQMQANYSTLGNNPRQIYSFHSGGVNAMRADGSVFFMSDTTAPGTLAALVSSKGGEAIPNY